MAEPDWRLFGLGRDLDDTRGRRLWLSNSSVEFRLDFTLSCGRSILLVEGACRERDRDRESFVEMVETESDTERERLRPAAAALPALPRKSSAPRLPCEILDQQQSATCLRGHTAWLAHLATATLFGSGSGDLIFGASFGFRSCCVLEGRVAYGISCLEAWHS